MKSVYSIMFDASLNLMHVYSYRLCVVVASTYPNGVQKCTSTGDARDEVEQIGLKKFRQNLCSLCLLYFYCLIFRCAGVCILVLCGDF